MNNDGGPAFPHQTASANYGGMSLRDYFAAKAMQGLCAALDGYPSMIREEEIANDAYVIAAAMLAERAK